MKKQQINDFKNKSIKDLKIQVKNLKKELAGFRIEVALGKLKNPHAIKAKKKDLAQILTLLKQKSLAEKITGANEIKDKKTKKD